jgi:phosphoglycolate phosphatase
MSSRFWLEKRPQPQDRYRLAVFDFDGTLVDSFAWFASILSDLAMRHRFRLLPREQMELLRGQDARAIMRHLKVAWWRLPAIARDCRQLASRDIERLKLFDGIELMLRSLADAGVTLAVVSTNSQANVRHVLGESTAVIQQFDCGSGLFQKRSALRRVMRRTGIPGAETIYIGDEIRDWEAAHAAGTAFGAVAWGYTRGEALAALKPAFLFAHVREITERLTGEASTTPQT